MRGLLVAAVAMAALAGGAIADPLGDAKAGLTALNDGDFASSIRLFSAALNSGKLSKADQELAHLKRGEAYLAAGEPRAALADANKALNLDPRDKEAMATRDRARTLLIPPTTGNVSKAQADYDAAEAKYEAQKQADADAYAKQMADYQAAAANYQTAEAKHQADLEAWKARQACKADPQKCPPAAGVTAQAAAPKPAAPPSAAVNPPPPR